MPQSKKQKKTKQKRKTGKKWIHSSGTDCTSQVPGTVLVFKAHSLTGEEMVVT
jgi:hypothetical protein